MKRISLFLLACLLPISFQAQELTYMYRLLLTGKGQSLYSIDQPLQFLSQKSIDRRNKQNIPVDLSDLPIDPSYFTRIEALGVKVVAQSKWMKTITVQTTDSLLIDDLQALPFVDTLHLVYRNVLNEGKEDIRPDEPLVVASDSFNTNIYGDAYHQIAMDNGNLLHEQGYRGEGITIAVIDGGFHNADCIDAFNREQILGTKNFSHITAHPFRTVEQHGTRVLSTMLSNKKNVMTGTAPGANYYLFCSEVNGEEFPVEEDYWISAIEYADSIGVDISTTSLGYTTFPDLPEMNHSHNDLDGKTALISRAATMAAEKGILVLNAGGNEGNKDWQKIAFPADADKIIAVGSVQSDSSLSAFTPYGPTADGRIKPDVTSMGTQVTIISDEGKIEKSSGTSHAAPITSGLMACLMQALPDLSTQELIQLVRQSSHMYNQPGVRYGYGIPDVFKAYESRATSLEKVQAQSDSLIRHVGNYLLVNVDVDCLSACQLTIYNILGRKVMDIPSLSYASYDTGHLPGNVYIAHLTGPGIRCVCKFIIR